MDFPQPVDPLLMLACMLVRSCGSTWSKLARSEFVNGGQPDGNSENSNARLDTISDNTSGGDV